eukprot:TRINITY_DN50876_c0_g1_i1.p1 TRINITY_DN50876_c0_g1~~TRINITY_DN50876_c0_g1_i1.p1  ORF type:complete len:397 (+),score=60.96 TRINITY_DN50876_c0_g1_i1:76-1191(+)
MSGKLAGGILASAIGTFSGGLGDNLVRRAYASAAERQDPHVCDADQDGHPPCLWREPLWLAGWALTLLVDTGANIVALALAPLEVIAPLGALHIMWATAFAAVINGEELRLRDGFGAFCVVCGVGLVLLAAPSDGGGGTVAALSGPLCQLDATATVVAAFCCAAAAVSAAPCAAHIVRPALAGLCGASSNALLALTEQLIAAAPAPLSAPEVWGAAGATALVACAQLWSLNRALALGEACVAVPVAQTVLLVGASLLGASCLAGTRLTGDMVLQLAAGIAVACAGICVLGCRPRAALPGQCPSRDSMIVDCCLDSGMPSTRTAPQSCVAASTRTKRTYGAAAPADEPIWRSPRAHGLPSRSPSPVSLYEDV